MRWSWWRSRGGGRGSGGGAEGNSRRKRCWLEVRVRLEVRKRKGGKGEKLWRGSGGLEQGAAGGSGDVGPASWLSARRRHVGGIGASRRWARGRPTASKGHVGTTAGRLDAARRSVRQAVRVGKEERGGARDERMKLKAGAH